MLRTYPNPAVAKQQYNQYLRERGYTSNLNMNKDFSVLGNAILADMDDPGSNSLHSRDDVAALTMPMSAVPSAPVPRKGWAYRYESSHTKLQAKRLQRLGVCEVSTPRGNPTRAHTHTRTRT